MSFDHSISAQVKALEAPGEALPNQEIFRRLAASHGPHRPGALSKSTSKLLKHYWPRLNRGSTSKRWPLPVQFMCRQPPPYSSPTTDTRHQVAKSRSRASATSAAGPPAAPEPLTEGRPPQGQFRLLSPASEWLMNSSFANEDKINRRLKNCEAWINPRDAATLGIAEGTLLQLEKMARQNRVDGWAVRDRATQRNPRPQRPMAQRLKFRRKCKRIKSWHQIRSRRKLRRP